MFMNGIGLMIFFLMFSFVLFHTGGLFDKSAIKEFVFANELPLVTTFSRESASLIFKSPIKKQVMLFASSTGSTNVAPRFVYAAKLFKGKPVGDYFSTTGDAPQIKCKQ